jgi:phosphohistidine phosphatase
MPHDPTVFYLVRHAKAEKDAPHGDAARRLTPEGRRRFVALAGGLAARLQVTRIVTSPLVRARETADILAAVTGAKVEEEPALASGSSSGREILALARKMGAGAALVGHNPEMAEAVALAAGREEKVRPGTIAEVDARAGGSLRWLEAPAKDE